MTDMWFDANSLGWIPGTLLGVFGGTIGAVAGYYGPKGQAKRVVMGLLGSVLAYCAILFVAGLVAYFAGQPPAIWYSLGYPGLLGLILFGILGRTVIVPRYRDAEMRRSMAKDL